MGDEAKPNEAPRSKSIASTDALRRFWAPQEVKRHSRARKWFKSASRNQRVVTGLKPSFSVDFSVNEGYFVSNMVVVLVGSKVAIVK